MKIPITRGVNDVSVVPFNICLVEKLRHPSAVQENKVPTNLLTEWYLQNGTHYGDWDITTLNSPSTMYRM